MSLRGEDGQERYILSAMGRTIKRVQTLDGRIAELAAAHKAHTALSRASMQKFALVRYDAFEDMGGQLSFSAAILDDHGDGLVITSINGRTETRTYAKPIKDWVRSTISPTRSARRSKRPAPGWAGAKLCRLPVGPADP